MKIIVGLGNPGPKYETTRHNLGFLAVDHLVDMWKARGPEKDSGAEIFETEFRGERTLLVKPQTFMNNSGKSVGPIFQFYKCTPSDLIVIHDEVDLKPMAIRVKTGGGTGGHNGLKSLDASLGALSLNYHRIRLGVGKPAMFNSQMDTGDWVLGKMSDEELDELPDLFRKVTGAVELILKGEVKRAMNEYNGQNGEK
jgi:PTH1 family peptidyl-tRNA hydrolase